MVAKLRVLSALCALAAAVIVVWQTNPAGPTAPGSVELRSTAAPLSDVSTTIKWPVIETVNPRPFDPCEDIPLDVIQRIGLAYTPPSHEDGLRCHALPRVGGRQPRLAVARLLLVRLRHDVGDRAEGVAVRGEPHERGRR